MLTHCSKPDSLVNHHFKWTSRDTVTFLSSYLQSQLEIPLLSVSSLGVRRWGNQLPTPTINPALRVPEEAGEGEQRDHRTCHMGACPSKPSGRFSLCRALLLPTGHLCRSLAFILQRHLKWPRTDLLLHTIRIRILREPQLLQSCPIL